MTTSTLTSLAILKVNIDQGRDYLEYLRPFVLQVLVDHPPHGVTAQSVTMLIEQRFGLTLPERTVEIVVRRLSKAGLLSRTNNEYSIDGEVPDPLLSARQAKAERHIQAVLTDLQRFSRDTAKPLQSEQEAVDSIRTFLAEFDITCLRAYLRGTTIPDLAETRPSSAVLVGDYVRQLQHTSPERFGSFVVLVQGHMLANALTCPDLDKAPKTFSGLTFYLDTPLLIRHLGCEAESLKRAMEDLVALLRQLEGTVAVFSHSRDELRGVLRSSGDYLSDLGGRPSSIVREARRRGTTRSDLRLLAASLDERLDDLGVKIRPTPVGNNKNGIDERLFEEMLEDEVTYANPRAREYDVRSVQSVYTLRGSSAPPSLEKARAVLVTSNAALSRAAWNFGQEYPASTNVSSVITDFSLANMAWLKVPLGADSIPATQLLSCAYAALEPSEALLEKYLREIERLEDQGRISERDHQVLRSDPRALDSVVHLTGGDAAFLGKEAVEETLRRLHEKIREELVQELTEEEQAHDMTKKAFEVSEREREETRRAYQGSKELGTASEKARAESEEAHERTRRELVKAREQNRVTRQKLVWRCRRHAAVVAWVLFFLIAGVLGVGGLVLGLDLKPPVVGSWLGPACAALFILAEVLNIVFGVRIFSARGRLRDWCENWLFQRRARALEIDLSDLEMN